MKQLIYNPKEYKTQSSAYSFNKGHIWLNNLILYV
ncbi:hypothetical protein AND4_07699 [Vibrio sp. AND4]|nr:hypothetical protein AND4_07699 [Vibrio sp. AND4]